MYRSSGDQYPMCSAGPGDSTPGQYTYRGLLVQENEYEHSPSEYVPPPAPLMYNIAAPSYRPPRAHPPASIERYLAVFVQNVVAKLPTKDILSRVSVTDYRGNIVLDTYVRPIQPVTDYRTSETGLFPAHLANGRSFYEIQREIATIIREKILIGYCLWDFLSVIGTSHPAIDTRDVALFLPFRQTLRSKKMISLPTLVDRLMARNIGAGYEDPLENARATLDLFRSCEELWEDMINNGNWPCSLPPSIYARHFT
ncbi:hypothetical protein NEOLEDRAFT_1183427 [Neolentinus lepideus HHB14362 ss-1]|uniref:Exonuclease domain-containing protein n=1 Tax=Neolentinus lepideus HHB14362 ss-1 TaxID=1314782 RepID=A0A165NAK7_9AGAM|nr:hypothetical protein NEOLEDRAFT_1183427 [Neolentinus lepideus HHB14362 ss-1]